MNYRHGYHAGNFADVVKHITLVAIILHLKKKDAAFSVIDTHAGRGHYDLRDSQAQATKEFESGVSALEGFMADLPDHVPGCEGMSPLPAYLYLVRQVGRKRYPGSPYLAAALLRSQDRLTAIEKHPEEFAILRDYFANLRSVTTENADGYARLLKLLPPPSRRGLVVIDPPFEATDEFEQLAQTLRAAVRKFANGVYLVWYPVKSEAQANAFTGEVLAAGDVGKALVIDTTVAAPEGKLNRAALLVINPPYGLADQMRAIADAIAPKLGADIRISWLMGSE